MNWIKARSNVSGQECAQFQALGTFRCAIAAQKLCTIASVGSLLSTKIGEGDTFAKFTIPRVPRKECS
jgi:hypothetical protein